VSVRGILRLAPETLFGRGAIASLAPLAASLGRHALVCTDRNIAAQPGIAAALAALAGTLESCTIFAAVEPDLPVATIARAVAAAAAAGHEIDVVVGLGGGSCLDAAKTTALLLRHSGPLERYYGEGAVPGPVAPIVAVPTTAGTGSEVTPVAVVADPARRLKVGVSSPHLIPRAAICDPELTLSCPPSVTAVSGIDALAHAVEAFTARVRPRDWSR